MRRTSAISKSVVAIVLASMGLGCSSAKITDAYMARDQQGVRKASCMRPEWEQFFAIVEMVSFKDDTTLTPVLFVEQQAKDDGIQPAIGVGESEGELSEFGNLAPGTGDHVISINFEIPDNPPLPPGEPLPQWIRGVYGIDLFLDVRMVRPNDKPDRTLRFTIDDSCPCPPAGVCQPPRVPVPLPPDGGVSSGGAAGAGGSAGADGG